MSARDVALVVAIVALAMVAAAHCQRAAITQCLETGTEETCHTISE